MTADLLWASDLHTPAVDAVLASARAVAGTEGVFLGGFAEVDYHFLRVLGDFPSFTEGATQPRDGWLCDAMLAGGPSSTSAAASVPAYASLLPVTELGVCSYVGVPLHVDGEVAGTLCGVDRTSITMLEPVVDLMLAASRIIEALIRDDDDTVLRRTSRGWRVGTADGDDLTSAMSLADLLADDLSDMPAAPPRPAGEPASDADRLRTAVAQLQHALTVRVVVEQAIGVLCERQHASTRAAFEVLRRAARSRGRRVHDLAREVVASASDPTVRLPDELWAHEPGGH